MRQHIQALWRQNGVSIFNPRISLFVAPWTALQDSFTHAPVWSWSHCNKHRSLTKSLRNTAIDNMQSSLRIQVFDSAVLRTFHNINFSNHRCLVEGPKLISLSVVSYLRLVSLHQSIVQAHSSSYADEFCPSTKQSLKMSVE